MALLTLLGAALVVALNRRGEERPQSALGPGVVGGVATAKPFTYVPDQRAAYERDARRLLVFFTRRTYDAQLAVDLVGETYARAFELRRRFVGDPGDADALRAALRVLLDDPGRRAALIAEGRRRADEFSLTHLAERFLPLYERAMAAPRAAVG